MPEEMVRFEGVSHIYPNGVAALSDINLQVDRGEFVFLVGPSGTGKSTLLRTLYRALVPTRGEVVVAGMSVARLSPSKVPLLRRKLGIVFQDYKLLEKKTAWENIAFALQVTNASRRRIYLRVPEILELVGLHDKRDALPLEMSGGEQQRLSIARALVNEPALLIADEPTGNLDPKISEEIISLLSEINSTHQTATIVATHDRLVVDKFRKRVVALCDGSIVSDRQESGYA